MLSIALGLLLFARSARAEESPRSIALVALASSQAQREVSERIAEQLGKQLSSQEVMLPAETRKVLLKQGGQSALRQAARKAAVARRALQAFDDLSKTAGLLQQAADAHLDQIPLLRTLDEPVQLFVELATVELARGRQKQVDSALQSAARLDSTFDLDPQEVSPRLVRAARQARTKVNDLPVLTKGRARRLAKRLGVDTLILVQPRRGPQKVLVEQYRASSGSRSRSWTVKGSDLSQIAAAFGADTPAKGSEAKSADLQPAVEEPEPEVSDGAVVFSAPPTERQPTKRPRRAWYRRWWVWTIIGVAVAGGAATGLYFGLTSQGGSEDLTLEVQGHW